MCSSQWPKRAPPQWLSSVKKGTNNYRTCFEHCFFKWLCRPIYLSDVSFIPFFIFGHFWQRSYENIKILRNLCLHFARQDGQDGKKDKENHATKVTKIPKTKRRKYGMNETLGYSIFIDSLDLK